MALALGELPSQAATEHSGRLADKSFLIRTAKCLDSLNNLSRFFSTSGCFNFLASGLDFAVLHGKAEVRVPSPSVDVLPTKE
jgi:hypothetical protein